LRISYFALYKCRILVIIIVIVIIIIIIILYTLGIIVPEGGLKKIRENEKAVYV